jgi:hypothetical protein
MNAEIRELKRETIRLLGPIGTVLAGLASFLIAILNEVVKLLNTILEPIRLIFDAVLGILQWLGLAPPKPDDPDHIGVFLSMFKPDRVGVKDKNELAGFKDKYKKVEEAFPGSKKGHAWGGRDEGFWGWSLWGRSDGPFGGGPKGFKNDPEINEMMHGGGGAKGD